MPAGMVEELLRHKWHANAAYLAAVCKHQAACADEELRSLLHHILIANRFWIFLTVGREFDREKEARMPDALEALIESYRETEALEREWLAGCDEPELSRQLVWPRLPGSSFTVSEAMLQVCLHSHGHRAQAAIRMRTLGATPPATDFILWAKDRPAPDWSFAEEQRR